MTHSPDDATGSEQVSFREWTERRRAEGRARTKGERTRERVKLAAIEILNEVGYRDMKVSDVCRRAQVTQPILYRYFANKLALTEEILREFVDRFLSETSGSDGSRGRTAYEAIYVANRRWIETTRANAGLVRCLLQLSDEVPQFGQLMSEANRRWYQRTTAGVLNRFPSEAIDAAGVELAAYALGGMIDDISRKLFTAKDPHLESLVEAVAPDDEALARFVSVLWYRALFAADPGEEAPRALAALAAAQRESRQGASLGRD